MSYKNSAKLIASVCLSAVALTSMMGMTPRPDSVAVSSTNIHQFESNFIKNNNQDLTTVAAATKKTASPFQLEQEGTCIIIYSNDSRELVSLDYGDDCKNMIAALAKMKVSSPSKTANKGTLAPDALEMRARNHDKTLYTYQFYTNGVNVISGSTSSFYPYTASEKKAQSLPKLMKKHFDEKAVTPSWLGIMTGEKFESITIREANGANPNLTFPKTDGGSLLFYQLQNLHVARGTKTKVENIYSGESDVYKFDIKFNSGVSYDVVINNNGSILIESSDMDEKLKYTLVADSDYEFMKEIVNDLTSNNVHRPSEKNNPLTAKPVIYLYPETTQQVNVKLDFAGQVHTTYPEYPSTGWNVTAQPDGTLTDLSDNSTHYYLFWDGLASKPWQYEKGSVVPGKDTRKFLTEALQKMGLTPREYNDFITFWLPQMEKNEYNLISFSGKEYEDIAKLTVTPKPDSALRVHMMWKPVSESETANYSQLQPQTFQPFQRNGFTLVEWGGTKID